MSTLKRLCHWMPNGLLLSRLCEVQAIVRRALSHRDEFCKFEYSEEDFIHHSAPWEDKDAPQQSKFDTEVQQRWDYAMANGAFRYDINNIQTRILPGPSGYVAQLNTLRAIQRREPQKITSVKQPFNPKEFNFNKVKPLEVIFELSKQLSVTKNIPNSTNGHSVREEKCSSSVNGYLNGAIDSDGSLNGHISSGNSEHNCNGALNHNGNNGTNGHSINMQNGNMSLQEENESKQQSYKSHSHNDIAHDPTSPGTSTPLEDTSHMLVINVSPMEYGHCLLVPNCKQNLPQVITEESLVVGIETMLLSRHRGLRLGFNSLCAFASVNHLHFHLFYLEYELISDYCHVKHLAGMYHEYTALPCPGFALQLHGTSVQELARQAHRISNYLYENDIAHNMFMCRGVVFGEDRNSRLTTIRLFIWPRRKFIGSKSSEEFNVACIELVGHLPIKIEDGFHNLTEPDVNAILADACLPTSEYQEIKAKVIEMGKEEER